MKSAVEIAALVAVLCFVAVIVSLIWKVVVKSKTKDRNLELLKKDAPQVKGLEGRVPPVIANLAWQMKEDGYRDKVIDMLMDNTELSKEEASRYFDRLEVK